MARRVPFPLGGGGGSGTMSWTTLLDADFAGDAGSALADGGTLVRSGVTWTLRAQSATFQTWTPATDGVDLAVANGTVTTNALLADLTASALLGRAPDDYDVLAIQARWADTVQTSDGLFLGVCLGHEDTGVARAGMDRPIMAGHFRTSASNWFARLSTSSGLVEEERFLATGEADPDGASVVTGGLFLPGLGVQAFGSLNRATLYDQPTDLRGVSMFYEPGAVQRPTPDRIGVIVVSITSTTTSATLSAFRVQHCRMPGAPEPS